MKILLVFLVSVVFGASVFLIGDYVFSREADYDYVYSFAPINDQLLNIVNIDICDDRKLVASFKDLEHLLASVLLEQVNNVDEARLLQNCNPSEKKWEEYRTYVLENYIKNGRKMQSPDNGPPTE